MERYYFIIGIIVFLAFVAFSRLNKWFKRKGKMSQGSGTVKRVLDDREGHQRFILKMEDGRNILVTHNIKVGFRLNGLKAGDRVTYYGEFIRDSRGGIVHWTHHDPKRWRDDGWLFWNGRKYT